MILQLHSVCIDKIIAHTAISERRVCATLEKIKIAIPVL